MQGISLAWFRSAGWSSHSNKTRLIRGHVVGTAGHPQRCCGRSKNWQQVVHGQHHLHGGSHRDRDVHPELPWAALGRKQMVHVGPSPTVVGAESARPTLGYIEWSAVAAGASLAAALSFVLLTF